MDELQKIVINSSLGHLTKWRDEIVLIELLLFYFIRKYFSYVQIYQQNMCVPSSFPLKYNAISLEKILLVVEYTHIYFDIYILIKL